MEVRIGVVYTARELVFETDEQADAITSAVDKAWAGEEPVLWLVDNKGRRIGIPTDKIAYVEVAGDASDRKVGFGVR
jgi:hypothetical protein